MQIEIERLIAFLEEGLLATVAALGHGIRITGQHEAGETSHEANISGLRYYRPTTGPNWCI